MESILDLISQPIPTFTKELDATDKELVEAFCAYLVTYAHISRIGKLTDDDKRALLAACDTLKRIGSAKDYLKELIQALSTAGGDEEFVMFDDMDDTYVLGYGEKEDILQHAGSKFTMISNYISDQIKQYRISSILLYEHSMGDIERFKISLNTDENYDAKLDDFGDISIMLGVILDIVDYVDYEIVTNNSKGDFSDYSGFENRINLKRKMKEQLEHCVTLIEHNKIEDLPTHLMSIFDDFDYLISSENKDTCIRKLINIARAVNAGDKDALKACGGDYIKYVTLYEA